MLSAEEENAIIESEKSRALPDEGGERQRRKQMDRLMR